MKKRKPTKTSLTDPLQIASVKPPGADGAIGVTFCPGKWDHEAQNGPWERDLAVDVAAIRKWGAAVVVCLLTPKELPMLEVEGLPRAVCAAGMAWLHLPIVDVGVPDAEFERAWAHASPWLQDLLRAGQRVLVHCKGGLGRTGTIAARLLVEMGEAPAEAMRRVREVRPKAIETRAQEQHVEGVAARIASRGTKGGGGALSLRERLFGCLLGGAVGDALGAPVEFLALGEIRRCFGERGVRDFAPAYGRLGAITDDTQMTLFTAEGLIRASVRGALKGICNGAAVVWRAYLRWLETQGEKAPVAEDCDIRDGWLFGVAGLRTRRAPGNTCLGALRSGRMGTIEEPINDSKGCGTVMRVAPVAVLGPGKDDLDWVFRFGAETGAITHGHPSGYLAAGAFAVIVAELLEGTALPKAVDSARTILARHERAEEVLEAIDRAVALAREGVPTPERLETLGGAWVAEEAVAVAIAAAWNAASFEDGVSLAVSHSGDSDSTGAMAGNLLGAMLGREAIPKRWLDALELRDVIERVGEDLCACYFGDGDPPWDPEEAWERYPGF